MIDIIKILQECFTVTNIIMAIPALAMAMIWYVHYLHDKKMPYWLIIVAVNILWMAYSGYLLFTSTDKIVLSGVSMIFIDNVVSIAIAVCGIRRLLNGKN